MAMITDHRKAFQGALGEEDAGPEPGEINADLVAAEMHIAQAGGAGAS